MRPLKDILGDATRRSKTFLPAALTAAFLLFAAPTHAAITGLTCQDVDGDNYQCELTGPNEGGNCYFFHESNIHADFYGEPCSSSTNFEDDGYVWGDSCTYAASLGAATPALHLEVRTGTSYTDADGNAAIAGGTWDCSSHTWTADGGTPPPAAAGDDPTVSATDANEFVGHLIDLIKAFWFTNTLVAVGITLLILIALAFSVIRWIRNR